MKDYTIFLNSLFEQIGKVKIPIAGLPLDHIAYQTATSQEYEALREKFKEFGPEANEEIVGGRRVAVYSLDEPIHYKKYIIPALELIEPKEGQVCESGYQHAEFVTNRPFEEYIATYPDIEWDTSSMNRDAFSHLKFNFHNGLTVKFLKAPILSLVG